MIHAGGCGKSPERIGQSPSTLQGTGAGSPARNDSSFLIVLRNTGSVSMSCAPISGHCAPWPVKTQPTRAGGFVDSDGDTSKLTPGFATAYARCGLWSRRFARVKATSCSGLGSPSRYSRWASMLPLSDSSL